MARGRRKIEDGLELDLSSRIYHVRKFINGRRCEETTGETNLYKARIIKNRILARFFGSELPNCQLTVGDYKDKFLSFYPENSRSYESHESQLRLHLLPYFQDMDLDKVGAAWKSYVASEKAKSSRKLRHDKVTMSALLNHALEDELIEAVPRLKIPAGDREPAPGREYTNDEIEAMLAHSPKNLNLHVETRLKTGMRGGETDKLKWEYIDFEVGLISLPPEVVKNRYGRVYPVDPEVLKKLQARFPNGSPYVFPSRTDKSKPKTRSDKQWQRVKEKIGLKGKGHWLRHTAATRMIRAGNQPMIVQKILGMSDQVMKRVYVHANKEDALKVAKAVGESMRGKK